MEKYSFDDSAYQNLTAVIMQGYSPFRSIKLPFADAIMDSYPQDKI